LVWNKRFRQPRRSIGRVTGESSFLVGNNLLS
jgi:hypothetical protein